jgi:hypothetical protein
MIVIGAIAAPLHARCCAGLRPIIGAHPYLSFQFAALAREHPNFLHDRRRHFQISSRAGSALPTFRRKPFTVFHDSAQSCAIYRIE